MARLIEQVRGHDEVWRRLQALRSRDHLPHALAFTGPSGVGKNKMAWALAQSVLCQRESQAPCGECGSCRRVEMRQSESVLSLAPASMGAPIKLEAAHQVLEFLSLSRLAKARVVIVDEAQSLNPQAANALLKVIEEPPPATHFILVVPEISQLLPTLRSRSQVVRFAPLSEEQLREGLENAEAWVVRSARGSFERLQDFQSEDSEKSRQMAFDFLTAAANGDRSGLEDILNVARDRETALETVRFLQQALRDWVLLETESVLHVDRLPLLRSLPPCRPDRKVELWRRALQMENDLLGHVDRSLVLENFFYQARAH